MSSSATTKAGISRLLEKRLQQFGAVQITAHGVSMFPFIREDDDCLFVAVEPNEVHAGDVLLFRALDDKLVGHRLIKTVHEQGETFYVCKGDTNLYPDRPVPPRRVLGKLTTIRRRGRTVDVYKMGCRLWTWLVLQIDLVSYSCRYFIRQRQIWRHRLRKLGHGMKLFSGKEQS